VRREEFEEQIRDLERFKHQREVEHFQVHAGPRRAMSLDNGSTSRGAQFARPRKWQNEK